jgi:aromatic-L-amino-acid decarboxylase
VEKAALLAGFGKRTCASCRTTTPYAMRAESLDAMIADDILHGRRRARSSRPRHDDVHRARSARRDRARARRHGLWLHVDAAMAGSAMILPECRWMWDGVEHADSLIVNAAQVARRAFRCTAVLRPRSRASRARDVDQPELSADRRRRPREELSRLGIAARPPLSARLKLWFLIREQGVEGLQARLRRDIANAKWLENRSRDAGLARARAGAAANRVRASRAAGLTARRSTSTRSTGRRGSISRAGLRHAGDARRPLDGARLDRRGVTERTHVQHCGN